MQIIPLGGLGEFGMNMMAIRYGDDILVIDAGLMFPRDDLLGVDLVIPDFTYLLENREKVRAVIVTHGHEDHIGALTYLLRELPIPVYGTRLTIGFARGRLAENGILDQAQLNYVEPRSTLQFGDLHAEIISMTHSIADSIGLAITSPVGTLIHTGDFKLDQSPLNNSLTDYARLAHFGEKGVLALLSDSRTANGPVLPLLKCTFAIISNRSFIQPQENIVACFASSIHRIQIILDVARDFGRRVIPVGRSMKENIAIASELGYLNIPNGIMADVSEAQALPDSKLVVLSTGSQGEPLAALTRLAFGKHKDFAVDEGDSVV
jgi:ribonuclease J